MPSRKDYIAVAEAIRAVDMPSHSRTELVRVLSNMFARDNDRFDRSKFRRACEPVTVSGNESTTYL